MNDKRKEDEADLKDSTSDDLTDEFLALDMGAIVRADNGAGEEAPNETKFAVRSLNKLEDDIHNLQGRWSAVESDLCKRDAEIEELKHQLSIKQSALTQLTNELDLAHEDNRGLKDELKSAEIEKGNLTSKIDEYEKSVQSREAEIESKRAQIDSVIDERDDARNELREAEKRLESERAGTREAETSAEVREHKSHELKEKIQDLEAYVDRRKEDWQKLQTDVAAYESTILGMEKIVREKDEVIALHQKETVEVSESLIDLEQQYAELDGRRAERELANRELQDKLVTASQDVERLNRETEKLRAEVDQITAELTDRHAAELSAIKTEHENALNLRTTELTDLREEFEDQERKSAEVCQELQSTYDRLQEANSDLREHGALIKDHEAALERYTEKLASAERELAARDQFISALETDLQGQKDTIEILGRNVQRLNELGTYVKTLDERISSQVGEHADDESAVETEMRDGSDTPCIISAETDQPIKYPLYKNNMTIGRSSDADIQLSWKFISREHAKIVLDGPAATIEDLGSKNGIFVNNEPVVRQKLHNGDRLEIGELHFTFVSAMH